jgi:hypothetical protein
MSVTMGILFLLLLLHATLTSAGGPPTNPLDRQSYANGNLEQVPVFPDHPESTSIRQSERHFWHWLHKQHRQSELRHKAERSSRSRRWKEVANGEDETNHHPVMLEKDDLSQPQLDPENSSSVHEEENHGGEHNGIHVASWRWDEIGIYITFTTFIIVAGLAKVGN